MDQIRLISHVLSHHQENVSEGNEERYLNSVDRRHLWKAQSNITAERRRTWLWKLHSVALP